MVNQRFQQKVAKFVQENNLEIDLAYRLLDLVSELGEVAKEVLKSTNYGRTEFNSDDKFADELGDLLFALSCIANTANLDLEEIVDKTLAKYQNRIDRGGAPDSGNE